MSVYTNAYTAAAEEANDYIEAVLSLVGDRDPIEILSGLSGSIAALVDGVDDAALRRPEAEGKWSMMGTILHLLDSEVVWGYRMRTVLAEDRPHLTGYDQDLWSKRLDDGRADLEPTLDAIAALRRFHVELLQSLETDALQRVGLHTERGEETLEHMVRLYAGHDLVHLRQLERIRRRVTTPD